MTPINSINFHNIIKVFLDITKADINPMCLRGKGEISAKRAGRNGMRKETWFGLTSKCEGVCGDLLKLQAGAQFESWASPVVVRITGSGSPQDRAATDNDNNLV